MKDKSNKIIIITAHRAIIHPNESESWFPEKIIFSSYSPKKKDTFFGGIAFVTIA